jgi:DNA-binding transcriptional MerR regulator
MNEEFWNSSLQEIFHYPINGESFEQSEVLDLLGIKPYQLRFWESEFDSIRPNPEKPNSRYSAFDLKILVRIKKYLMEDQLTIEKAKALIDVELKNNSKSQESISIEQAKTELSQSLNASAQYEESMNMNALYEEMSLETFKQADNNSEQESSKLSEVQNQQVRIKSAIQKIRERLKNWS